MMYTFKIVTGSSFKFGSPEVVRFYMPYTVRSELVLSSLTFFF